MEATIQIIMYRTWGPKKLSVPVGPNYGVFWCYWTKEGTCFKQEPIIYAYSYAVMGDGNNHVREQRPDEQH